jgi:butyrate response factor
MFKLFNSLFLLIFCYGTLASNMEFTHDEVLRYLSQDLIAALDFLDKKTIRQPVIEENVANKIEAKEESLPKEQEINQPIEENVVTYACVVKNKDRDKNININNTYVRPSLLTYFRYDPNLFKTELCKNYSENKFCRHGNKCQFAHGKKELRKKNLEPNYKTKLCENYAKRKKCPYGIRCYFAHGPKELRSPEWVISASGATNPTE